VPRETVGRAGASAAQQGSTNAPHPGERRPRRSCASSRPAGGLPGAGAGSGGRDTNDGNPGLAGLKAKARTRPSGNRRRLLLLRALRHANEKATADFRNVATGGLMDASSRASSRDLTRSGSGQGTSCRTRWHPGPQLHAAPGRPQVSSLTHPSPCPLPRRERCVGPLPSERGRVRGHAEAGRRGCEHQFKWSVLWTGESGQWLLSGSSRRSSVDRRVAVSASALGSSRLAPDRSLLAPCARRHLLRGVSFRNVPLLVWMFFRYFAVPPCCPGRSSSGLRPRARILGRGVRPGRLQRRALLRGPRSASSPFRAPARGLGGLRTHHLPGYRYVSCGGAAAHHPPGTNESLNLLKNSSVALTSASPSSLPDAQIETYTARHRALHRGVRSSTWCSASPRLDLSWVEPRTAIPGLIVGGRQRR